MKRIVELDGLRALAVGMVIADHCQTIAPWPWRLGMVVNGGVGVTIFFVLSGYLITRLLAEEQAVTGRIALPAFYLRRALRIWPASYAYLLFVAAAAAAGVAQISGAQLAVAALHLWNYAPFLIGMQPPEQGHTVLGHFWSLALEEQFYWLWPMLLIRLGPVRVRPVLVAIVAAMAWVRLGAYVVWPAYRGSIGAAFHTALDPLAIGALLALYEPALAARIARASRHAITLGVAALLLGSPVIRALAGSYWTITYGVTVDAALAGFVILAAIHRPDHGLARMLRLPPLRYLGAISFSLYLWQQLFCISGGVFAMRPLVAVPLSVAVASLSFYAIERPFLRLRRGMIPDRRLEPLPPA